jgi:putative flippase GtrA
MTGSIGSFIRFCVVGLSNTLLGMAVIYLAWAVLGMADVPANMLGYAVGFLWSYVLNRRWTFKSTRPAAASLGQYLLVYVVAYLANLLVLGLARHAIGGQSFLPHVFGAAAYTMLGYLGSRYFVFADRSRAD